MFQKNQIKNFPSDLKFPIKGSNSKFWITWLLIFHKNFTSWIEEKGQRQQMSKNSIIHKFWLVRIFKTFIYRESMSMYGIFRCPNAPSWGPIRIKMHRQTRNFYRKMSKTNWKLGQYTSKLQRYIGISYPIYG